MSWKTIGSVHIGIAYPYSETSIAERHFLNSNGGKRVIKSVQEKMKFENLAHQEFNLQKLNHWRINGRLLYEIFSEVENPDLNAAAYSMVMHDVGVNPWLMERVDRLVTFQARGWHVLDMALLPFSIYPVCLADTIFYQQTI